MSTERETAIAKIMKCLALAKSTNEHEAAIALGQAQAMMKKYDLEDLDLLAAEVSQRAARSGARKSPVAWETCLGRLVARAFGCNLVFQSAGWWSADKGDWLFIGCGPAPEIAGYAFEARSFYASPPRAPQSGKLSPSRQN